MTRMTSAQKRSLLDRFWQINLERMKDTGGYPDDFAQVGNHIAVASCRDGANKVDLTVYTWDELREYVEEMEEIYEEEPDEP